MIGATSDITTGLPGSLASGLGSTLQASQGGGSAGAFEAILQRAQNGASEDEIREAAEELVAGAFIAPVLRQIRETSDAAPPFQPTPAEKQFGQMMDAETAKQIVRKSRLPIVDRLTRTFEQYGARRAAGPDTGVLA